MTFVAFLCSRFVGEPCVTGPRLGLLSAGCPQIVRSAQRFGDQALLLELVGGV